MEGGRERENERRRGKRILMDGEWGEYEGEHNVAFLNSDLNESSHSPIKISCSILILENLI